jgi:hypothetical protein
MSVLQPTTRRMDAILEGGTMTTTSITLAPPNSLVFIEDAKGGMVPDPDSITPEAGIIATDTCIAVCCLCSDDGPTKITMGPVQEVDPGEHPAFDGILATPTRTVAVTTVEADGVLVANVPALRTRIRIWTNRPKEPDNVVVGFG